MDKITMIGAHKDAPGYSTALVTRARFPHQGTRGRDAWGRCSEPMVVVGTGEVVCAGDGKCTQVALGTVTRAAASRLTNCPSLCNDAIKVIKTAVEKES